MKNPWDAFIEMAGTTISGRGRGYFKNGMVDDLEEIEAGYWTAGVYGTERYHVTVQLAEDHISEWSCDCPYDGHICKHVVAVVYGIQEAIQSEDQSESDPESAGISHNGSKKKARKPGGSRVERILANVSEAGLREFIIEAIRTEPGLKNLLIARFAGLLEDDPEKKYRTILSSSLKSAMNRYNLIDDLSLDSVERMVTGLRANAKELCTRGKVDEAALIFRIIIEEISQISDIDYDSEYSLHGMLTDALCELQTLAEDASDDLRSKLFNWCMTQLGTSRYRYMGFENEIIRSLPPLVTGPAQDEEFLQYIHNGLKIARSAPKNGSIWFGHSSERTLLSALMDYHAQTGQANENLLLLEANIHIPEFRQQLIEKAIGERDFRKARELCFVTVKETDTDAANRMSGRFSTIYRDHLLQIARLTGDTEGIRTWCLDQFLTGWKYAEFYTEYKSTWSGDEWETACENLISLIRSNIWKSKDGRGISSSVEKLGHIYIQEEYWPQLLLLARAHLYDPDHFNRWKHYLISHYPEQVIEMLESLIRKQALQTGREHYRTIAARLREINNLPGGGERAYAILSELLETYSNRPAMREEFKSEFPEWVR